MPNFNNRLAQVRTESLRYAVISCHGIAWFFLWYSQCRQLFSHFVIVFMDGRNSHTKLPCDVAFIAHTGVFSQVSGELLFLRTDTVGILCGLAGAECGNLGFHLEDQVRQLCFDFLTGSSIYISGVLLAIRPDGRVSTFPDVVIDLLDIPLFPVFTDGRMMILSIFSYAPVPSSRIITRYGVGRVKIVGEVPVTVLNTIGALIRSNDMPTSALHFGHFCAMSMEVLSPMRSMIAL